MERIDKFLLDNPDVTQEAREDIMESMTAVIERLGSNVTTISGYGGNTPLSLETENIKILIQLK